MPRQISTIQIRGKHNGQSFYTIKGKQGGWMRNINQAMSGRVKSDPEFENTRRYATEFGHVQEWLRAYTYEVALGQLRSGKKNLRQMVADRLISTLHHVSGTSVGQRNLPESGWQKEIEQMVNNAMAKRIPDGTFDTLTIEWGYGEEEDNTSVAVNWNFNADMFAEWQSKGATDMMVRIDGVNLQCKSYNPETGNEFWGFNPETGLYAPVQRKSHNFFYGFMGLGISSRIVKEYLFTSEVDTPTHQGGYTWDKSESTFFLRIEIRPCIGVRPNAKFLAGEGFVYFIPYMKNINF